MKNKAFKIVDLIFVLIFSLMLIYSGYKIYEWKKNNNRNAKINTYLHEYINVGGNDKYNESLKKENKDTIGYINVPNTNIDYVVVRGKDNDYYLDHNFNKEYNKSGWVFADFKNKFDGTDKNIIIYAHNTVDKSMFGSLKQTLNEDWYKDKNNHTIILVTEEGLTKYHVFSVYKIDNEEYYINTMFNSDDEFDRFLKKIKSRSIYDFGVETYKEGSILTLSTCANSGKKRVVMHAIKESNNESNVE